MSASNGRTPTAPQSPTRRDNFKVNELTDRWGCGEQLIYRRMRRGLIRGFRVGGEWRIPADEVARIEAAGPVADDTGQPTDDIEANIAALVAKAPPLTDAQRIRLVRASDRGS